MSFFSSLERPANAQPILNASKSCIWPAAPKPTRRSMRTNTRRSARSSIASRSLRPGLVSVADTFISCLVMAGSCRKHSPCSSRPSNIPHSLFSRKSFHAQTAAIPEPDTYQPSHEDIRPSLRENKAIQRNWDVKHKHNLTTTDTAISGNRHAPSRKKSPKPRDSLSPDTSIDYPAYIQSKYSDTEDSRDLLDFYFGILGHEEGAKSLRVVLSNPEREVCLPPSPRRNPRNKPDRLEVHSVSTLVSLLEDGHSSNEIIFEAYKALPSPRMPYLSERSRGLLLHRFAAPTRRRRDNTLRYLAMVDDMCKASLHVSPSLWTAAIHLAGKSSKKSVRESDLTSAIGIWRRMEHEGNVASTSVTFNILFDIAIKSGQFQVAERIMKEMNRRGVDFSRFGRVARIFLSGLQRDADAVRKSYDDFVKAGEIVDTAVLNCTMVSLARAGQIELATQMFNRMKSVHQKTNKEIISKISYPRPSDTYAGYRKGSKKLGRILGTAAYLHDKLPAHHRAIQAAMPLTPDAKSFHIFLSYHAYVSGDLERFIGSLRDMEDTLKIQPQGMVYIFMFHGFAIHGGKRTSPWTYPRLKRAWALFLRALHASRADIQSHPRTMKRVSKFVWNHDQGGHEQESVSSNKHMSPEQAENIFHTQHQGWRKTGKRKIDDIIYDDFEDERRYQNNVYLGRRMIISCLRAFSVCGGPDAVLDVWEQIEPLWFRDNLNMSDITAVKTVLHKLVPDIRW